MSGVCGSDVSKFNGAEMCPFRSHWDMSSWQSVEEVGGSVQRFQPGDLVTSDLNFDVVVVIIASRTDLISADRVKYGRFSNRAFAQFGSLQESYLLRIESEPKDCLVLSEPLSCAMHTLSWANPDGSGNVLVIGAGGIGLCLAFALTHGEQPVQFDITDISPERLRKLNPSSFHTVTQSAPDGEYDIVLDASGTAAGLDSACRLGT